MPDDDGVGPYLDFLHHEPEHALTIGDLEGLGGIMELGEKTFKALGERHVRLGVEEFRLQGGELGLGRRLAVAQGRHARAELIERDQLLLIGFDQPGDRGPVRSNVLSRLSRFTVMMVGPQLRQPAINFGAHQRGILSNWIISQTSASTASCRTGRLAQRRPSGYR